MIELVLILSKKFLNECLKKKFNQKLHYSLFIVNYSFFKNQGKILCLKFFFK